MEVASMALNFLDIFILAVLIISIVMLITGNGELLLNLFGGKSGGSTDAYDKPKLMQATLILCIVLLIDELCLLLAAPKIPAAGIASIAVTVCAFVVYIIYLKKYAAK